MKDDQTTTTFLRQILTLVLSILLASGVMLCYYFSLKKENWDDGFWFIVMMYGGLTLFVVMFEVPRMQFDRALEPMEVFKLTLKFFAVFEAIILVQNVFFLSLASEGFWFNLAMLAYNSAFFLVLALIIASIQSFPIFIVGFDKYKHIERISSKIAVRACKQNKLTYREKIYLLNQSVWGFILCLLLIPLFLLSGTPHDSFSLFLISILFIFFLYFALYPIVRLTNPSLSSTKGYITYKSSKSIYRSPLHKIYCDNQNFIADGVTQHQLVKECDYKFWYIPSPLWQKDKIIAYDCLETPIERYIVGENRRRLLVETDVSLDTEMNQIIKFMGLLGGVILLIIWLKKRKK